MFGLDLFPSQITLKHLQFYVKYQLTKSFWVPFVKKHIQLSFDLIILQILQQELIELDKVFNLRVTKAQNQDKNHVFSVNKIF